MEKSRFLVLVFSFIPGAGEMYLNMMKKGATIMGLFWGISFISGSMGINSSVLMFALPVIWFYSFFETHNMKHFTLDYRKECDDRFFYNMDSIFENGGFFSKLGNRNRVIGIVLIIFGFVAIFKTVQYPFYRLMDSINPVVANFIHSVFNMVPDVLISIFIIFLGFRLIKGKNSSEEKDYIEYTGKDDDYEK